MYSNTKSFYKREDFFFLQERGEMFHKSFSLSNAEMYIWGSTDTDKSLQENTTLLLG